ncbi:hypothetical protein B1B00_11510 [Bacillus sp. DSM 27956]|jgi:hypothetical protein|uniref:hypothetical protein n=1 Tax=Rossellomorea vietnamensis TaxID=218284 RepID=UPI0005521D53|nr:hypothetical protein [Rossellomorea vietnamensis]OXS59565.1 hypothetical protein B1B00_11510 [Bacillus sp. DSM 27956]
MNSAKQDKNQRLRIAQSLYRMKNRRNIKYKESKLWTAFIIISVLLALCILIITELYYIDSGESLPGFLKKMAEALNLILWKIS